MEEREEVLAKLYVLINDWVQRVSTAAGFDAASVEDQRGLMFTFGSYRLGVHKPGGDIDVLVVGPQHCTREHHFFGTEPYCLEAMLRACSDVTDVQAVPGAFIPVIKVELGGVDLDLLFAPLPVSRLPLSLDLRGDAILRGVDERTAKVREREMKRERV